MSMAPLSMHAVLGGKGGDGGSGMSTCRHSKRPWWTHCEFNAAFSLGSEEGLDVHVWVMGAGEVGVWELIRMI